MSGNYWVELVKEGFLDPRRSAERIVSWNLSRSAVAEAYVLVAILSVLGVFALFLGAEEGLEIPSPVYFLVMQCLAMGLFSLAVWLGGKMFGGKGDLEGSVRILVWMQALMVLIQFVQIIGAFLIAPVMGVVSMLFLGVLAWICSGLIAGLHGFRSQPLVFLGMIGGLMVVGFAVAILLLPFLPPM